MDLSVTASSMTVECPCGAQVVFHNIHDGWQRIRSCDGCRERISVQIDDPIAQTVPANWPPPVPA